MGLFQKVAAKFPVKGRGKTPPIAPTSTTLPQAPSPQTPSPPQAPLPPPIRSLDELERQMALEAQAVAQQSQPAQPKLTAANVKPMLGRVLGLTLLIGIPIGMIALINLPYAPIRRPIAQKAPLLLMPSYIQMDSHFRQAVAAVEEAKQLVDQPTSLADLERGEQKIQQAQASLDQLPTWVWSELPNTQWWWYGWRMSPLGFNQARAEIGRLQGKVFQEKNAQTALSQAQQALGNATQQYQEARSPSDQQAALRVWQEALDQLQQIPAGTLAGKMAQQVRTSAQRDFEANGGLITNQQTQARITAARQLAWKAALAAQNPPHSVAEWQQVIELWQQAIAQLEKVTIDDLNGYTAAQKLLATYTADMEQIKVRKRAEADSARALQQAKEQIAALLETTPSQPKSLDRNTTVGQLQRIINQLELIDNGTTAYPKAQQLLKSAKDKIKQL